MRSRAGRPTDAYKASLKKPKLADYQKLVEACLEAIINGENDILVAFSYTLKYPKDFPKGVLHSETDTCDIRRIKARKLLTWLHEKGYTPITVSALKEQRRYFSRWLNEIVDLEVDVDQKEEDNDLHQLDEDQE